MVLTNTSAVDTVTINTLTDDFGDTGNDLNINVANCDDDGDSQTPFALPVDLEPNESITCVYTVGVTGNAGDTITNVAKGSGTDDDGNPVSGSDDADVDITNTPSSISVVKTANPISLD